MRGPLSADISGASTLVMAGTASAESLQVSGQARPT